MFDFINIPSLDDLIKTAALKTTGELFTKLNQSLEAKYGDHITEAAFSDLLASESSYVPQLPDGPVGSYSIWLVQRYYTDPKTMKTYLESKELHSLLDNFRRFGRNLEQKDIYKYKTIQELENAIMGYFEEKGVSPESNKTPEYKTLFEDTMWKMYEPLNHAAAIEIGDRIEFTKDSRGNPSRWCFTYDTSQGLGFFKNYSPITIIEYKGPLATIEYKGPAEARETIWATDSDSGQFNNQSNQIIDVYEWVDNYKVPDQVKEILYGRSDKKNELYPDKYKEVIWDIIESGDLSLIETFLAENPISPEYIIRVANEYGKNHVDASGFKNRLTIDELSDAIKFLTQDYDEKDKNEVLSNCFEALGSDSFISVDKGIIKDKTIIINITVNDLIGYFGRDTEKFVDSMISGDSFSYFSDSGIDFKTIIDNYDVDSKNMATIYAIIKQEDPNFDPDNYDSDTDILWEYQDVFQFEFIHAYDWVWGGSINDEVHKAIFDAMTGYIGDTAIYIKISEQYSEGTAVISLNLNEEAGYLDHLMEYAHEGPIVIGLDDIFDYFEVHFKLNEPYYGWQGDVSDKELNEALQEKLSELVVEAAPPEEPQLELPLAESADER